MGSWQIVFDHARRVGFPIGRKERIHGAGSVPPERLRNLGIARDLAYLDRIETLSFIGNDHLSRPVIVGGGWAFSVAATGQLFANHDSGLGSPSARFREIVQTAYTGPLPDSEDREPCLGCPILRAAFTLVSDRDRLDMSLDLRQRLLDHHEVPLFDDIATQLSEDIAARMAAGADVLHRHINVSSLEAFSGDLEAYLLCAVVPDIYDLAQSRSSPLAPHHVGALAVQMPEAVLAKAVSPAGRKTDGVRWTVISALLLNLGPDHRSTLANLADVLLLEGAAREDLMERGSYAVVRWVDALHVLSGVDFHPEVTRVAA